MPATPKEEQPRASAAATAHGRRRWWFHAWSAASRHATEATAGSTAAGVVDVDVFDVLVSEPRAQPRLYDVQTGTTPRCTAAAQSQFHEQQLRQSTAHEWHEQHESDE